jgi:phosphoesterase RecJ-like protein
MPDLKFQQMLQLIQESKKIAISGHIGADLDSIGSTLAMYEICDQVLKQIGKEAEILPIIWEQNDLLRLQLPYKDKLIICEVNNLYDDSRLKNVDLFILLDLGEFKRSPITNLIKGHSSKVIVIDHHVDSCLSDINKVDLMINYHARSTATMIYKELVEPNSGLSLTKSLAQNLLAGIYGDTDYLSDVDIESSDFRIISRLIDAGADLNMLVIHLNRSLSLNKMKAVGQGLNEVQIQNNFALCVLDYAKLTQLKLNTGYILQKHDILDEIRRLDGIDFAIVIFETEQGFLTASLKSRTGNIDLEKIARHFGGGGHRIASAFRFETKNFRKSVSEVLHFLNLNRKS